MNKKEYVEAINEIKADETLKRKTLDNLSKRKKYNKFTAFASAVIVFVLAISIAIPVGLNKNKENPIEIANTNNGLPKLENFEEFYNMFKDEHHDTNKYYGNNGGLLLDTVTISETIDSSNKTESVSEDSEDFSKTNVQVEGVDEADIVKTDGNYIYYIKADSVVIVNAQNSEDLKIETKISYSKENFSPLELYVNKDKLIIIGEKGRNKYNNLIAIDGLIAVDGFYSYNYNNKYSIAKVYNVENKNKPKLTREIEVKGSYLSSRMIDNNIYFITNDQIYPYQLISKELDEINENDFKPKYKDTAVSNVERAIDYDEIYYFPDSDDASYLSIAGFNINNDEEVNIETYLGAGDKIYSSQNNLYITREEYKYKSSMLYGYYNNYEINTHIYKFELEDGNMTYKNAGSVPGKVLNQFSMDEKDGYFRIATTDSKNWNSETNSNNMYVLNENLETVGSIENLAKGEKIYSVRFMGDRAYMVTFVQTDPLFVIDLSEPTEPKVLGELKIPGYSKYLHPYDETHIIGFGENTRTNEYGGVVTDGMKMALFDVSNPNKPKELYSVDIGDKGTYSEILNNHKALLFSKEKNIIAFPISISEQEGTYKTKLKFQGAIVYGLDLENGFDLKGTIAHMKIENGYQDYDYGKKVERILYIKDSLYTLSESLIKSTNIATMEEEGNIEI